MPRTIELTEFLQELRSGKPVFDVRSPAEFEQAHLPAAVNLPLFNNEERAQVGTTYKHDGKVDAINLGLTLVGPKLDNFVEQVRQVTGSGAHHILLHCWRGGMRSASMASFLEGQGFEVSILEGGYKTYRQAALALQKTMKYPLIIIGGYTGGGKTEILQYLAEQGEQVLDLEALANHLGSAFGSLAKGPQPSQEQFENSIFSILNDYNLSRPIIVEDESRLIGRLNIPIGLFENMRSSHVFRVELPLADRVKRLVSVYGDIDRQLLLDSVHKIRKRLGGLRTAQANEAIEAGQLAVAVAIILEYYDKAYDYGMSQRDPALIHRFEFNRLDLASIHSSLSEFAQKTHESLRN